MGISRAQLKFQAKNTIQKTKPNPILISTIYTVILLLFSTLRGHLAGISNLTYDELYHILETFEDTGWIMDSFSLTPQAGVLLLAVWVVSTLISAGFSLYALRISRNIPGSAGTLFDGFGIALKILAVTILQAVFVFLWSLLFVIPGIVAAYRYRQALYLQLDHPDWPPMACIRASKEMMQGRKLELFVLDLSFFLWIFFTGFPYFGILVSVWLYIYQELTFVNYYNSLLGSPFYERSQDEKAYWTNHE